MKIGTGFHFPATLTQEQLFTCRQPDRDAAHERNSYSPHLTSPPQVCTCTCMRAHTTALWINSSSTLLLAITAEGHTSAAGLSSRKKKAWFLCNLSPELAGTQESCSSQARKTRTQPQ